MKRNRFFVLGVVVCVLVMAVSCASTSGDGSSSSGSGSGSTGSGAGSSGGFFSKLFGGGDSDSGGGSGGGTASGLPEEVEAAEFVEAEKAVIAYETLLKAPEKTNFEEVDLAYDNAVGALNYVDETDSMSEEISSPAAYTKRYKPLDDRIQTAYRLQDELYASGKLRSIYDSEEDMTDHPSIQWN